MMKFFKLPILAGLSLATTMGLTAQGVKAEKAVTQEVATLVGNPSVVSNGLKALMKDTASFSNQTPESTQSVIVPSFKKILADGWSYEKQISQPSTLQPVTLYKCVQPVTVKQPTTGFVYLTEKVVEEKSSFPNATFTDKQTVELTKKCTKATKGSGKAEFPSGVSF